MNSLQYRLLQTLKLAYPNMLKRQLSPVDRFITQVDRAIRTLSPGTQALEKPSPAGKNVDDSAMSDREKHHAAGLMRVNHTGEVCAQALYQGQALTANLDSVREQMEQAAAEEVDHLAWCEERVNQLESHISVLNPLWYGLSFGLGAAAGLVSDKVSLGFVAATEEQVCQHLEKHLACLPENDTASKAVVQQMLEDERHHAETAIQAGGIRFPWPIKAGMALVAKVMTTTSYRI